MRPLLDDRGFWFSRAEEVRTIAEITDDPEARRILFDIAESYDCLADDAAGRDRRATFGTLFYRRSF